jgi:hypothetical protein
MTEYGRKHTDGSQPQTDVPPKSKRFTVEMYERMGNDKYFLPLEYTPLEYLPKTNTKEIPPPEGDGGQQRIAGGEAKDNT